MLRKIFLYTEENLHRHKLNDAEVVVSVDTADAVTNAALLPGLGSHFVLLAVPLWELAGALVAAMPFETIRQLAQHMGRVLNEVAPTQRHSLAELVAFTATVRHGCLTQPHYSPPCCISG